MAKSLQKKDLGKLLPFRRSYTDPISTDYRLVIYFDVVWDIRFIFYANTKR